MPLRSSSLLAAIAVVACGGAPSHEAAVEIPGATRKTVTPLDIKADANAPYQALILGTDASGGSTIIPLAQGASTARVDSMWFELGPPAIGGSSPVTLSTAASTDGSVRAGMPAELAAGRGPQWRAGVWLSAVVASSTLGKDLTDVKFAADAAGNVDGASASGLMTAGFLAALTGTKIDGAATMTGIINPDGTIGPVAGIPQTFTGAIAKGKKRLGYPIGMRHAQDVESGHSVDLVALAKAKGAKAIEISDVYAAYRLMTGQKLPRPVPVDDSEMQLEHEVVVAFETKYVGWQTQVSSAWERILELDSAGRLPPSLANLSKAARDEATEAEKLRKQGVAPAAYRHIVTAWIYAASATSTADILESTIAGDVTGAKAKLHEVAALTGTTEQVLRKIGALKPATIGGHLQMLSAFDRAITGLAASMQSDDSLAAARAYLDGLAGLVKTRLAEPEITEQTVAKVAPAVLQATRSAAATLTAVEGIDIEGVRSLDYMTSLPDVKRLAVSFQSAAAANVTYFETLMGITDDITRNRVAVMEPDYLTAFVAANLARTSGLPEALKQQWGDGSLSWALLSLASARLAYFKASLLISKWYSLDVQNDWLTGQPTAVGHEQAFTSLLLTAERKAREYARAAKVATGSIPVQARIAYQNARSLRQGGLADKLAALEAFWQSSAYAQAAVMLARN